MHIDYLLITQKNDSLKTKLILISLYFLGQNKANQQFMDNLSTYTQELRDLLAECNIKLIIVPKGCSGKVSTL